MCKICNDVLIFIPGVSNLNFHFLLSVLLENFQFYWPLKWLVKLHEKNAPTYCHVLGRNAKEYKTYGRTIWQYSLKLQMHIYPLTQYYISGNVQNNAYMIIHYSIFIIRNWRQAKNKYIMVHTHKRMLRKYKKMKFSMYWFEDSRIYG